MFDDPGKRLRQLDRELKAEQPPAEEPLEEEDFFFPGEDPEGNAYYEEDYRRDWKSRRREKRKADGCGGLRFLAAVEILAIVCVIGWWILWLNGIL